MNLLATLSLSATLLLTGCASVYRGEGYVLTAKEAEVGRWDATYYIQSDAELKRFNVWWRSRNRTIKGDCDDYARKYEIDMIQKYLSYSWGGKSIAVQTNLIPGHMNNKVQTTTGVKIVEPQTGEIKQQEPSRAVTGR